MTIIHVTETTVHPGERRAVRHPDERSSTRRPIGPLVGRLAGRIRPAIRGTVARPPRAPTGPDALRLGEAVLDDLGVTGRPHR